MHECIAYGILSGCQILGARGVGGFEPSDTGTRN